MKKSKSQPASFVGERTRTADAGQERVKKNAAGVRVRAKTVEASISRPSLFIHHGMPTTQWAGPETPRARGQRRELDNELHSIPHLVSTADNELSGRGRRARLYFFF